MNSTLPRHLRYKQLTTEQQGHEETGEHSEEEEEGSAVRGTEESQVMSEAGLTVRMGTDLSSSSTFQRRVDSADLAECCRIHSQDRETKDTGGWVPKPLENLHKLSPLPSFFVAPLCRETIGLPSYMIPVMREVKKQAAVPPKKENCSEEEEEEEEEEGYTILKNENRVSGGSAKHPARTKSGIPRLRNPKNSKVNVAPRGLRTPRPSTEPPPGPRRPRSAAEPPQGKTENPARVNHLQPENAGGGEVKEKLVYVVEENGKNVCKVETDLFTLNEILTIKKDLLELSEFARKLKRLKERGRQESEKAGNGACQCEPTAQILKDVNKRIEALEMRQEELEKGSKFIQKEVLASKNEKEVKTLQTISPEPAKPNANVAAPGPPKKEPKAPAPRPPDLSSPSDLVNELQDIKEKLKRLETKRPRVTLEESPAEEAKRPKRKDGAIAVFSSKTYIFSPDKLESRAKERKASEDRAVGDKVGFDEAKIINWLKGVCSVGSDFKVLLHPSPTMLEDSLEDGRDTKVEFTCRNCSGPMEERGAYGKQEPQKNRGTQKDLWQDDFPMKESSSRKILNSRSYGECFVSPSGKFFAWMKRSSDKIMRNFCSDWPQPKILQKVRPRQISRTTSTGSIVSAVRESPRKEVRCSVVSELSVAGNIQDFVRMVCKSEKTAMNENMKFLEKRGRRSLSRDKLQKEDKNEAVRRKEPLWGWQRKSLELSPSSSFSEFMETLDFDMTSNSTEAARWQRSNEFHAQVFSYFTQPDYLMDTSRRRTEWVRQDDSEGERRRRKQRKAERQLLEKAARMQKSCEKQRRKLARQQEKYASRCSIKGRDIGNDYWREYSVDQVVQQPQVSVGGSKQMPANPPRSVYKKPEQPPNNQLYVGESGSGPNYREDNRQLLREDKGTDPYGYEEESIESMRPCDGVKYQPERTKSVLSAEKPSFEKYTLTNFLKSFGWLYPRAGDDYTGREYRERKRTEFKERSRVKRDKKEYPPERALAGNDGRADQDFDRYSEAQGSDQGRPLRHGQSIHHDHDPDQVENCDCVRLYLQNQVEKNQAMSKSVQTSSEASSRTASTISSRFNINLQGPRKRRRSGCRRRKDRERDRQRGLRVERSTREERRFQESQYGPERQEKYITIKRQSKKGLKKNKKKIKLREGDVTFCTYCGTAPCRFADNPEIAKQHQEWSATRQSRGTQSGPTPPDGIQLGRTPPESAQLRGTQSRGKQSESAQSGRTQSVGTQSGETEEAGANCSGESSDPKKRQSKHKRRQAQENSILSYLFQLWKSKPSQTERQNAEEGNRPPDGENSNVSVAVNAPETEPGRGKPKAGAQCMSDMKSKGYDKRKSIGFDDRREMRSKGFDDRREMRSKGCDDGQEIRLTCHEEWPECDRQTRPKIFVRRCDRKELDKKPGCAEQERYPSEAFIETDDKKMVECRSSAGLSDHSSMHAHCFLIEEDNGKVKNLTEMYCYPETSRSRRRGRRRMRRHHEKHTRHERHSRGREHRYKDQAIECHVISDPQDVTDKTTVFRCMSCERFKKNNLRGKLASLYCLWQRLRRCTLQKAMYGREVGKCIRKKAAESLSGLDTYEYWGSDAWSHARRRRALKRRLRRMKMRRGLREDMDRLDGLKT